jgi:hypothetical protein
MGLVWLLLGSRPRYRPVGPFGFSWRVAVWPQESRFGALDFLGFPWILSSESRLFNGLRGIFAGGNFTRPFAAAAEASRESSSVLSMQKRRIILQSNLTWFLILCKELLSTEIASEAESPRRQRGGAVEPG